MEEILEPEDKYALIRDALFRLGGRVRSDVLEGEVCGRKHRWRAEPLVLSSRTYRIYIKILVLKGDVLKTETDSPVGKNIYYELVGKLSKRLELHRCALIAGLVESGKQVPPVLETYRKQGETLLKDFPDLVPKVGEYGSKRFVTWMSTGWKPQAASMLGPLLATEHVLISGEAVIPLKSLTPALREALLLE